MGTFHKEIKFIYPWRAYQQRILDELELHMVDRHIHVVAPPGSGKTVLGLEIMLRLNQPVLIFAPTLIIRNQWADRFLSLFVPEEIRDAYKEQISFDIRETKLINIVTYQSLHALFRQLYVESEQEDSEPEDEYVEDDDTFVPASADKIRTALEAFLHQLESKGIKVLILDEAHHLRNEWWKALVYIKEHLEVEQVVAVTATPPFDSTMIEWDKYINLCGDIDTEIYVPELVKNGDLCPHQDYIYFSAPDAKEQLLLNQYRAKVKKAVDDFKNNDDFVGLLIRHPYLADMEGHLVTILEMPAYYASILAYLENYVHSHEGQGVSIFMTKVKLVIEDLKYTLGLKVQHIRLDDEKLIILLEQILFQDAEIKELEGGKSIIASIRKSFSDAEALHHKKVILDLNPKMIQTLYKSTTKYDSMEQIFKVEYKALGKQLRMVILSDYIRKAEGYEVVEDLDSLGQIGVVPIFDYLRLKVPYAHSKIGILTGSYVVIPKYALALFYEILQNMGADQSEINELPLAYDELYIEVNLKGDKRELLVEAITRLFESGGVYVLVGTKALLGEGWDAPCVNTLVLASFVGSYMLSNQMRGRAIRAQQGNADKTANIWHLVCVEAKHDKQYDLELLDRRMDAFVGPSFSEDIIVNGMARFNINYANINKTYMASLNQRMEEKAVYREQLIKIWKRSTEAGKFDRMISEEHVPKVLLPSQYIFRNMARVFIKQFLYVVVPFIIGIMILNRIGSNLGWDEETLNTIIGIPIGIGVLVTLPKTIQRLLIILRHRNSKASLYSVAKIIVESLHAAKLITYKTFKSKILVEETWDGNTRCTLMCDDSRERELFLTALREFLGVVDNPRYLLERKEKLFNFTRNYYYQVPTSLGTHKETATFFAKQYNKKIGDATLAYTRNPSGRMKLLMARASTYEDFKTEKSKRVKVWQ